MDVYSPKPFDEAARQAFPFDCSSLAHEAVRELTPFVDDTYRQRSDAIDVLGNTIALPRRLHFVGLPVDTQLMAGFSPASRCLITRATDGYLRQCAVQSIIGQQAAWSAPFVLISLADYVIGIVEDVCDAIPALDQSIYGNLVRENRGTVRKLRARATSYWNAYHRPLYPVKRDYPGLWALREMETWAA